MSKVAQRYAKAFFTLAEDNSVVKEVLDDMNNIQDTLSKNKELRAVVLSPVISLEKKKSILEAVFSKANAATFQLISTLITNKRIQLLNNVAKSYIKLYEIKNNIQRAKVVVACEMNNELADKIQKKVNELTGQKVDLTTKIDPSILGGFILTINDLQYDASMSGRLNKFKNQLVN